MNLDLTLSRETLLAVIPAHNEARHISEVVQKCLKHLGVLVVDDGSEDGTASLAREAGAEVLIQTPNQGKGAALRAGFRHAIQQKFSAVITLDGDGQHDPDELPRFIEKYHQTKADLIIGSRDFSKMPPLRRFSNRWAKRLFSWYLGINMEDNQSGYRLISQRLQSNMLTSMEAGFEFEVEMLVNAFLNDYTIAWVPISTIYADERSHIKPLQHAANYFRIMTWARNVISHHRNFKHSVKR